jgi:hypothetical protein
MTSCVYGLLAADWYPSHLCGTFKYRLLSENTAAKEVGAIAQFVIKDAKM